MKQHLLPVYAGSLFKSLGRFYGLGEGEWWDKGPLAYPHALISYVHWKQAQRFPTGAYIFGDSGGFALVNQRLSEAIDPVAVLKWQESLCSVGCIVDKPPRAGVHRPWNEGLEVTIANTARALRTYLKMRESGTAFRWYGVLHGNNEAEVRSYYEAVSSVYPFTDEGEGWAIRAEPQVNVYAVARSLRIMKDLGIKRAHFLAATSQDVIATLLTLGPEAGLEHVTYDSTSAIKFGANRKLWIPSEDGLTFTGLVEAGTSRIVRDYVLDTCPCIVCAHMRVRFEEYVSKEKKWRMEKTARECGGPWLMWFQLHNLHIQQQVVAVQARVAATDPAGLLQTALPDRVRADVRRIFHEDGFEPNGIVRTGSSASLLDYLE